MAWSHGRLLTKKNWRSVLLRPHPAGITFEMRPTTVQPGGGWCSASVVGTNAVSWAVCGCVVAAEKCGKKVEEFVGG